MDADSAPPPPPAPLRDAARGPAAAAGADTVALAALIRRHHALVETVCRRVLGPGAAVDDAMQATWIALARHGGGIRQPAALAAWLHRVAWRCAVRLARERRRHWQTHVMLDDSAAPSPAAARDETDAALLARVDAAVQALPARYRDALFCAYHQRLDGAAAARQLGLTLAGYKTRLARARARLERTLRRGGLGAAASAGATGAWAAALPTSASLGEAASLALAAQAAAPAAPLLAVARFAARPDPFSHPTLLAVVIALTLAGAAWWVLGTGSPKAILPPSAATVSPSSPRLTSSESRLGKSTSASAGRIETTQTSHASSPRAASVSPGAFPPGVTPLPYRWQWRTSRSQPSDQQVEVLEVRGNTPGWQPGAHVQVRGRYRTNFDGGRLSFTLTGSDPIDSRSAAIEGAMLPLEAREGEFVLTLPLAMRGTPHLFFTDASGTYHEGLHLGDEAWIDNRNQWRAGPTYDESPSVQANLMSLKAAADRGDRDAAREIALSYADGKGALALDPARAYRWFLIAGESTAAAQLAPLLTPAQRAEEEGFAHAHRQTRATAASD